MADLVLVRFDKTPSREAARARVKRLREAALAVFPKGGLRAKVGSIGGGRFKVTLPEGEGAVDAKGARFDLDAPAGVAQRGHADVHEHTCCRWRIRLRVLSQAKGTDLLSRQADRRPPVGD